MDMDPKELLEKLRMLAQLIDSGKRTGDEIDKSTVKDTLNSMVGSLAKEDKLDYDVLATCICMMLSMLWYIADSQGMPEGYTMKELRLKMGMFKPGDLVDGKTNEAAN